MHLIDRISGWQRQHHMLINVGLLTSLFVLSLLAGQIVLADGTKEGEIPISGPDLLSFSQGAQVVSIDFQPSGLKIDHPQALQIIDGNPKGFSLTPKPGSADTKITVVFSLPAKTQFRVFAIPYVLETPSPSQTFIKNITISGSMTSADSGFKQLASSVLEKHPDKNQQTILLTQPSDIRWLKVELSGGLDVQREKTYFGFSELEGYGTQEAVAIADNFTGKWKGRGVLVELHQDQGLVSGCYDRNGNLTGAVNGNILRATGSDQSSGVQSLFILSVDSDGNIEGVRSTNGAPFRRFAAPPAAAGTQTQCSKPTQPVIGCGSILYGINFDYDSDRIRADSTQSIQQLYDALQAQATLEVSIEGHTSNEGSATYNQDLSERRAQSLVQELVRLGVDKARISAVGRGEAAPIADNSTEAGRSLNRRVEVQCVK